MKKSICAIPVVAVFVIICVSYAQRWDLQASLAFASRPMASASSRVVLYAAVGAELTQYDVDVDRRRSSSVAA
jgi:hypothetical protein